MKVIICDGSFHKLRKFHAESKSSCADRRVPKKNGEVESKRRTPACLSNQHPWVLDFHGSPQLEQVSLSFVPAALFFGLSFR